LTFTDTVGFVRHLPHQLIEAFRSTLEEVKDADLIVHVVDGSDEDPTGQINAVREVLNEIGAHDVPEMIVINKADIADVHDLTALSRNEPDSLIVSAKTGMGIAELITAIEERLPHPFVSVDVLIPFTRGDLISRVHRQGEVISVEHSENGTHLIALAPQELATELEGAACA
jgi:GTP-binding protein HflX